MNGSEVAQCRQGSRVVVQRVDPVVLVGGRWGGAGGVVERHNAGCAVLERS